MSKVSKSYLKIVGMAALMFFGAGKINAQRNPGFGRLTQTDLVLGIGSFVNEDGVGFQIKSDFRWDTGGHGSRASYFVGVEANRNVKKLNFPKNGSHVEPLKQSWVLVNMGGDWQIAKSDIYLGGVLKGGISNSGPVAGVGFGPSYRPYGDVEMWGRIVTLRCLTQPEPNVWGTAGIEFGLQWPIGKIIRYKARGRGCKN